ncbi:MAG: aspartate kinase, partial [Vicinamibacterales bacterium]|nr:aspartate kinase [Vicinamibacterales bacterium]
MRRHPADVWKFGGASLADGGAIQRAARRIAAHDGPLVVVASALAGVTDLLLSATGDAARRVERLHRQAANVICGARATRRALDAGIDEAMREYRDLCAAIAVVGHRSPRMEDTLVARGERLSALLLSVAVAEAGRRDVALVDALDLIRTDDRHGGATPLPAETRLQVQKALRPRLATGGVVVVPGYLGRAPDGGLTTLGRGGSDLTATLIGQSLGARTVVLWKDVPGILTADPRLVPDARLIPHLHHREAAEVAHYGAKVLHPRALIPLARTRTTLHVRSFLDPAQPGTEVSGRRALTGFPVKALALLPRQAIITVAGKGMLGVPGIAARTFAAVEHEGLSVSTIFQASSESSIGFTVPEAEAERAVRRLRQAFQTERAQRLIDDITARPGMSVIAVVGDRMAGAPGIAARVFSALAAGGLNVIAIAQGSSERNISFVVPGADAADAMRRVHTAFQLSKIDGGRPQPVAQTDVVLLGLGRVGRELTRQITGAAAGRLRIVGVIDRSACVFDPRGIARARLARIARGKAAGTSLADLGGQPGTAAGALDMMHAHAVSRPVIVDVTNDETAPLLRAAIARGFDVVLANKKPLSGARRDYVALWAEADASGRRLRYEATVGAGLPIIDTFNKLDATGDRVTRIEGCVSGTLMFVLSQVSQGRPFSEAVREAVARGYAEPDPRDDLSGRDAARKGLILARMLGYRGAGPRPDNLVPTAYRRLGLDEFLARLPELDGAWRAKAANAAARDRVWRYVVTASARRVTARLVAVASTDPLGAAAGTRNVVTFRSRRYQQEPLVVSGPGAGAAVTAAGLLNDIHALVGSGEWGVGRGSWV